jgi:capsule polysaccharide modification protein KpsS
LEFHEHVREIWYFSEGILVPEVVSSLLNLKRELMNSNIILPLDHSFFLQGVWPFL